MNNSIRANNKSYLAFLLFIIIIIVGVTYLLVYKISFLPNGYDIVSQQKNSILIKTFNILGVQEGVLTIPFSDSETWKIDDIDYEVGRYKEFLWLLFSAISISSFLLISKVRKRIKLGKAILVSSIVLAVLLPIYHIINSLNRIHHLIS
jgi:hypothetical protein